MNNITQDQFNAAVLNVTAGPDWDIIKKGLQNDIYQIQAGALDAKDWDTVCESRGFAQGVAYMINLRDSVIGALSVENDNADV